MKHASDVCCSCAQGHGKNTTDDCNVRTLLSGGAEVHRLGRMRYGFPRRYRYPKTCCRVVPRLTPPCLPVAPPCCLERVLLRAPWLPSRSSRARRGALRACAPSPRPAPPCGRPPSGRCGGGRPCARWRCEGRCPRVAPPPPPSGAAWGARRASHSVDRSGCRAARAQVSRRLRATRQPWGSAGAGGGQEERRTGQRPCRSCRAPSACCRCQTTQASPPPSPSGRSLRGNAREAGAA